MKKIFLGLGSNVGDRRATLGRGLEALSAPDLRILRVSPIYETEPQGLREQEWFLNLVAEAETSLFPRQLLQRVRRVEREFGRKRTVPNGPRTLDIDILFFARSIIQSADLQVPHPSYSERRFVLAPMADLAPDWRDPRTGRSMRALLDDLKGQKVQRVENTSTH